MASRVLRFNRTLMAVSLSLVILGLVMIYSSSAVLALTRKGSPNYFFIRQLIWVVIGLGVMLVMMKIPYEFWKRRKIVLGLFGLQILLLLTVLTMPAINGSHRWIRVGPITLQPSEAAKFVLILLTAYLLEKRLRERREWRQVLVAVAAFTGATAVLILLQPDLGTVVVIGLVVLVMLFNAGMPLKWFAGALILGTLVLGMLLMTSSYRRARLMTFMHPGADPQGAGFQARQSLIAVGSGGLAGKWFSGGSQKLLFLPEPHTDFIYAMIGEELGLGGTLGVLSLLLVFGAMGCRIVRRVKDPFAAYAALGIVSWIVVQALLHILVTLTLLPTKGLPFPLVSYGGSSLVAALAGVGLLLNISQYE